MPQTEFVKTPGRTLQDALVNYGPFHQRIEHMIALAKFGVTGLSTAEHRDRLIAMLKEWNAEPPQSGQDLSRTAANTKGLIRKVLAPHSRRYFLHQKHVDFP